MNLRFLQREPGGPKVLQEWDGKAWQAVPLVEEWRCAVMPIHQGAMVPTMDDALRQMFDAGPPRRTYHDSD